jgi:ankyrin repeat protein
MEIQAEDKRVHHILQAAYNGDIKYLRSFKDHDLRNSVCKSGCTTLHWAAGNNQVEVLRYLITERKLPADILAVRYSKGRTPLHYSCRNGCLEATRFLVEEADAKANTRAKHGVTPFQLAVWQNQLKICQYMVEKCKVDPKQVNKFDCGAIHWLGICPKPRANQGNETQGEDEFDGKDLLPLAKWLAEQPGLNYAAKQRQGHSVLHKAAWGGHLALIKYLRNDHGLWDDSSDAAGNGILNSASLYCRFT